MVDSLVQLNAELVVSQRLGRCDVLRNTSCGFLQSPSMERNDASSQSPPPVGFAVDGPTVCCMRRSRFTRAIF